MSKKNNFSSRNQVTEHLAGRNAYHAVSANKPQGLEPVIVMPCPSRKGAEQELAGLFSVADRDSGFTVTKLKGKP